MLVQEFVRVEFPLGAKEPELGGGHNVPQGHQTVEQHSHKLQELCFKSDDLVPIKTGNVTTWMIMIKMKVITKKNPSGSSFEYSLLTKTLLESCAQK